MNDVGVPVPTVFTPNPHLSDEINSNIIQSEIEGGVSMHHLPKGSVVEIETQNRVYTLVSCGEGEALLHGHPTFCPEPVLVNIHGSTWGGTMLGYCASGMINSDNRPAIVVTSAMTMVSGLLSPAQQARLTPARQAVEQGRSLSDALNYAIPMDPASA